MFDLGWAELLIVAVITIIVVGPKELPGLLRSVAKFMRRIREMSDEFRRQVDEAVDMEEMKKLREDFDDLKEANPVTQIKDTIETEFDDFDKSFSNDNKTHNRSSSTDPSSDDKPNNVKPNDVTPSNQ